MFLEVMEMISLRKTILRPCAEFPRDDDVYRYAIVNKEGKAERIVIDKRKCLGLTVRLVPSENFDVHICRVVIHVL